MINYGYSGLQVANFHYQTRLISSYQNKIFYDIFSAGVVPNSGDLAISPDGTQIIIPSGFSMWISPNNQFTTETTIQANYNLLDGTEKNILDRQLLKCDIVKDFGVTQADTITSPQYLVAEYNYLDFSDLPVDFKFVTTDPTGTNLVLLATITLDTTGLISTISTATQTQSSLNNNILLS